MTRLTIRKNKLQQFLLGFIDNIQSDEVKIEFDDEHFVIRNVEKTSVLDKLISEAEDLGPEDLSINVDHYLYGLPKRRD
jgi:antitoxin component of MazEF toxin-antitoxin module